ncbi:MAG TPA: hypothetical protein VG892_07105 [Terriglobales bacterium]|jgi:hypothetical protein|nr:hypothetical protein [Terriglobales bacterium]
MRSLDTKGFALRKLALSCLLAISCLALAEDKFADLKFSVTREDTGKPVRNASIVLHPVSKSGKMDRSGGLQLKTDSEGMAEFRGAPYGKLRIQVLARGFQTYGSDHDIDEPTEEIAIQIRKPQEQYSIYEEHPSPEKDGSKSAPQKQE